MTLHMICLVCLLALIVPIVFWVWWAILAETWKYILGFLAVLAGVALFGLIWFGSMMIDPWLPIVLFGSIILGCVLKSRWNAFSEWFMSHTLELIAVGIVGAIALVCYASGNASEIKQAHASPVVSAAAPAILTDVSSIQRYLKKQGYYTGKIDGLTGPLTNNALALCISAQHCQLRYGSDASVIGVAVY